VNSHSDWKDEEDLSVDHLMKFLVMPLQNKVTRYVSERGSPLYGHVSYFGGRGATQASVFAWVDWMRTMAGWAGKKPSDDIVRETIAIAQRDGNSVQIRPIDWPPLFCFYLTVLRNFR